MKTITLNIMSHSWLAKWARSVALLFVACALLIGAMTVRSQSAVLVDPAQPFVGYLNAFALPADGGGYQFGSAWAAGDLRATYSGDFLKLQSCTNVSNPTDAYWTKPDGTGNKQIDASWYVQNDGLLSSNITYSGNVVNYALTSNYVCQAFIKVFNSSFSVIQSSVQTLTNGNSFFSLNLTASAAGGAHVQYGFETVGRNAPWTNCPDSDGFITIRTNHVDPLNALVNPSFENGLASWTTYGNGGNIETTASTYYNGGSPAGASNVLVYEGLNVQKVFPQFSGGANYNGIYQDIPTGQGSVWSATAKFLTHHQDQIGVWAPDGTNQCWLEVTFRDAANNVLATYKSANTIDVTSPTDTWIDMRVTNTVVGGINFTSPVGTTKVRIQEVYYQPYGYAGGSVYADKMVLDNLSASDPNITTLPISQTKLVGQTVTFTVVASGATTLSYVWKTNGVPLVNGGGVSGVATSTLTLANVQKFQTGAYTVDVTDVAGTLTASAYLTVQTAAEAANALINPSFETGSYSPWVAFNGGGIKANGDFWAGITVTNYDGNYGSAVENGGEYDGAYQDVSASPGQVFSANGWFFLPSTYPLTENAEVWLEVQFRNGGTPLSLYKSTILGTNNPSIPMDTWINLQATNGFAGDFFTPIPNATYLVAPANTTTIRYQITGHFLNGSGGVLYDALALLKKLSVTVTATTAGGNLNLSWLSQGGTSYQVVYKNNLTDISWTPIGGLVAGTGAVVMAPAIATTSTKRFYSVQTQ